MAIVKRLEEEQMFFSGVVAENDFVLPQGLGKFRWNLAGKGGVLGRSGR
jgi:hypothetical protein